MGLDMYAYTTKEPFEGTVDFVIDEKHITELHYWRKHPNLHGWMEQLYYEKGGTESFNCVNVELDSEDIDRLEDAIHMQELPPTGGFFFGESDGSEIDDDVQFIRKARQAIREEYSLYYTAWW